MALRPCCNGADRCLCLYELGPNRVHASIPMNKNGLVERRTAGHYVRNATVRKRTATLCNYSAGRAPDLWPPQRRAAVFRRPARSIEDLDPYSFFFSLLLMPRPSLNGAPKETCK